VVDASPADETVVVVAPATVTVDGWVVGVVVAVPSCTIVGDSSSVGAGLHVNTASTPPRMLIVDEIFIDFSAKVTSTRLLFGCQTVFGRGTVTFNGCASPFAT